MQVIKTVESPRPGSFDKLHEHEPEHELPHCFKN